ncbi:RTA1 like protein-domain-containing protein [Lipomyces mesembrius]
MGSSGAPNSGAAILFCILFGLVTSVHTYQLLRTRIWWFIPFVVGGYLEFIGFICRAVVSYQDPISTSARVPNIIMTVFILIAPVWFAASIYILFGRIILLLQANHLAIIKQKWLTGIFVTGDVLSLVIQVAGAVMLTGTNSNNQSQSNLNTAKIVIDFGLAAQIVSFGFFIVTAIVLHRRILKQPAIASNVPWKKHLYTVYLTSTIIMCRCIFRLVEYLLGTNGPIWPHEAYQYGFDSTLMFFVMVAFAVIHPSEVHAILKGGGLVAFHGLRTKLHEGSIDSPIFSSTDRTEEQPYEMRLQPVKSY